MKRQSFIIPGTTDEKRMMEVALENTLKGDDVFIHYHGDGQTCNQKCHIFVIPEVDEGDDS